MALGVDAGRVERYEVNRMPFDVPARLNRMRVNLMRVGANGDLDLIQVAVVHVDDGLKPTLDVVFANHFDSRRRRWHRRWVAGAQLPARTTALFCHADYPPLRPGYVR